MIDATLYNSADSYLATRNVFLQTKKDFDIEDEDEDYLIPIAKIKLLIYPPEKLYFA
ncbi:MAG: hypothetical protein CM15mP98_04890 [Paracoccaceae bacterium]|nr:MAG: hypothetical protein CM15mP98_04890 [Paracoccaceae bacterium]